MNSRGAIADIVRSYFNALAAGDGKRACALMTGSAQLQAVALGRESGATTCEEAIEGASSVVAVENRAKLLNTRVTDISIHADTARASALEGEREVRLLLTDGKWQILGVEQTGPRR